jgi:hypothetical protein
MRVVGEMNRTKTSTTITAATQLIDFRAGFYRCWTSWADAAFELTDALLCAPGPVTSIPGLSLEPAFRRSHGSLYKAIARGDLDAAAMRDLLARHRPTDWPLVFAVDASTWPRCAADTSPERGYYYSASKHSAGQPIVAGWSYQWICQLDWACDSWTAPMDAVRIRPRQDSTTVTTGQIRALLTRLGSTEQTPVFVFDAGYDPTALTHELTDTKANLVVRIRDDRLYFTDPAPTDPGTGGRPRRHGRRVKLNEPGSWPAPAVQTTCTDPRSGTVHITAWHRLHPRLARRGHWASVEPAPIITGTVVRIEVQHLPKHHARANKPLWLWISGPNPDLDLCWRAYLRRFDIEHTFRFAKNTLGWTTPRFCTPDQADRWTWQIIAAYTQLRLARDLVDDHRLPWERRRPNHLTPGRVRRGFPRLSTTLHTPANPPKPGRAGPGRPKGSHRGPRTRHAPIKKAA